MSPFTNKTALCCAGGGSRGIYQTGFLWAFHEMGFDYSSIYAASVGAINGAMYHQGDIEKLKELWLNIRTEDVYHSNMSTWLLPLPFISKFTKKLGLFDSSPLYNTLKKYIDYDKLLANPRKMVINTTDLRSWQEYNLPVSELKREELHSFILGSASPPIAFTPVEFRKRLLADGGIINNYGISSALEDGHSTIVVLTPTRIENKEPDNITDMVDLMTSIPPYHYLEKESEFVYTINRIVDEVNVTLEPDYSKVKLVVVRPPKPTNISLLDFNYKQDRKALIQYGYEIAKEILTEELLNK